MHSKMMISLGQILNLLVTQRFVFVGSTTNTHGLLPDTLFLNILPGRLTLEEAAGAIVGPLEDPGSSQSL